LFDDSDINNENDREPARKDNKDKFVIESLSPNPLFLAHIRLEPKGKLTITKEEFDHIKVKRAITLRLIQRVKD
jgi:hypothetical protein